MRALAGRTIVVTRPRGRSEPFRRMLEEHGARVLEIPLIEIAPRPAEELEPHLDEIARFDWLVLTSANAAGIFIERLARRGSVARLLPPGGPPAVCAVGPATARELEQRGVRTDLLPLRSQAEGIVEAIREKESGSLQGLRFLLPRAARARRFLPDSLRSERAEVREVILYDTVLVEESREALRKAWRSGVDLVAFTSSSTVEHFVELAGMEPARRGLRLACIGPVTAATARRLGLEIAVESPSPSTEDFTSAIVKYFQSEKRR